MSILTNRIMCVRLISLLVLLSVGGLLQAAPLAPWSPRQHEPFRDRVGNPRLHNSKAAVTRAGHRLLGAEVPTAGTVRLLAIPVQFAPDEDANTSGTGEFPYATWGPASDANYLTDRLQKVTAYFTEVSGGRVTVVPTLAPVVTLTGLMATYADDINGTTTDEVTALMRDVVAAGDDTIDFAPYDLIMLIHAGAGSELSLRTTNQDIYSHHISGVSIPTADGVDITGYAVVPETECNDDFLVAANPGLDIVSYEQNPTGDLFIPHYWDVLGVWVHELSHGFGMADLYDVNYSVGLNLDNWSLMASGSYLPMPADNEGSPWLIPYSPTRPLFASVPCHPDAWSKQLVNWAPIVDVTDPLVHQLVPPQGIANAPIYRIWRESDVDTNKQYFLVENRANIGYDKYVPEHGLMIYHIDDSIGSLALNNLQVNALHPRVMPESADGILEKDPSVGNFYPKVDTAWPSDDGKIQFGPETVPNSSDYSNVATDVDINRIEVAGDAMYADFRRYAVGITFQTPSANEILYVRKPTLRARARGLKPTSLMVYLDGDRISVPSYDPSTNDLYFQLGPLADGQHIATVTGLDALSDTEISQDLTFTVRAKVLAAGKAMIAMPAADVGTIRTVLSGIPFPRVATWNPTLGEYQRYPNPNTEFTTATFGAYDRLTLEKLTPAGRAFWVDVPADTSLNLEGDVLRRDRQYVVPLEHGFNMIGNPYTFPVGLGSVLVDYNGTLYDLPAAAALKLVDPVVYSWDANSYDLGTLPDAVLYPWVGYWIYCRGNTNIRPIRLVFQPITLPTTKSTTPTQVNGAWDVTFCASDLVSGLCAKTTLGVSSEATNGTDIGLDVLAPPAVPDGIAMAAQSRGGEALLRDYRAAAANAQYRWDLSVSGTPGSTLTVTWPSLLTLPKGYLLTLRDAVSGEERYLRTSTGYTFTLGAQETSRAFEIMAVPGQPGSLRVVNPQAVATRGTRGVNVTFQLTQAAAVTVEFRTAGGRVLRRLSTTTFAQGPVTLRWDGLDQQGHAVARGAYLCQIIAETSTGQKTTAITALSF